MQNAQNGEGRVVKERDGMREEYCGGYSTATLIPAFHT